MFVFFIDIGERQKIAFHFVTKTLIVWPLCMFVFFDTLRNMDKSQYKGLLMVAIYAGFCVMTLDDDSVSQNWFIICPDIYNVPHSHKVDIFP